MDIMEWATSLDTQEFACIDMSLAWGFVRLDVIACDKDQDNIVKSNNRDLFRVYLISVSMGNEIRLGPD